MLSTSITLMISRRINLDSTFLNVLLQSLQSTFFGNTLPWPLPTLKHNIHFLQCLAFSFWCSKEHVYQGETVEGSENHVHLPVDMPKEWWDGEGESAVPAPIGGSGEGDRFGSDLGREDFGGIGPGGGALYPVNGLLCRYRRV
jgi:hypothetical protein